jgi:hypothetical protein
MTGCCVAARLGALAAMPVDKFRGQNIKSRHRRRSNSLDYRAIRSATKIIARRSIPGDTIPGDTILNSPIHLPPMRHAHH